jgi:iron complex transport system substrate-binding protein
MNCFKISLIIFNFIFVLKAENFFDTDCSIADDHSRIIIAGGSLTEIVFFLGLEDKLIGVDITSNFPESAKEIPSIGYVRTLSAEGILSLEPSLILGENDMGPPMVIDQIQKTSVDLRIIPEKRSVIGILEKINCIGSIINYKSESATLINDKLIAMVDELLQLQKTNSTKNTKAMLILSMGGTSPVVAGRNTSGNGFINMIGAQNIFESHEGWKSVSEESILKNNPDIIIIPKREVHKNSSIASFLDSSHLKKTKAVKKNNIISEDAMAMLGFGPRTIDIALKTSRSIAAND